MPHDNHTTSNVHQELEQIPSLRGWLDLSQNWADPFPEPVVKRYNGIHVVREDLVAGLNSKTGIGGKARAGSYLFQDLKRRKFKKVVYVAPRFGFAAISCAALGKLYGIEVHLIMPACNQISEHQMVAIELGAKPHFVKIAAMPNANRYAEMWAYAHQAYFIPLGLRHKLVTAALVRTAHELSITPTIFCTAMSTGVLNRALQIAWPQAKSYGVAVARNIHAGEKGNAEIHSCELPFAKESVIEPDFNSCSNYDLKAWEWLSYRPWETKETILFWNVAGNIKPKDPNLWQHINSQRAWGDHQDLT